MRIEICSVTMSESKPKGNAQKNAKDDRKNLKRRRPEEPDDPNAKPLLPRASLNLSQTIGQTKVINPTMPKGGYYCEACKKYCTDSMTWMDHLNGRRHLRNVGTKTKAETATKEDVAARLAALKAKIAKPALTPEDELKQKVEHAKEEEQERKKEKREKKKRKKQEKSQAMDDHLDLVRRLQMQAEEEGGGSSAVNG